MTALYIIGGIIAFFVIVLSVKLVIKLEYSEQIELRVKWLFLNIKLLPLSPKAKVRKEQKQAAEDIKETVKDEIKGEEELKGEQAQKAPAAQKKPSMLKDLWNTHGYDGLVKMLKDTVAALNTFVGSLLKGLVIETLVFNMRVSSGDAAQTAVDYGRECAVLYPLFGSVISRLRVRKYDINIYPDFLAGKNDIFLKCDMSIRPISALNASFALLFRLLVRVVLKLLFKKPQGVENKTNKKSGKGGASK